MERVKISRRRRGWAKSNRLSVFLMNSRFPWWTLIWVYNTLNAAFIWYFYCAWCASFLTFSVTLNPVSPWIGLVHADSKTCRTFSLHLQKYAIAEWFKTGRVSVLGWSMPLQKQAWHMRLQTPYFLTIKLTLVWWRSQNDRLSFFIISMNGWAYIVPLLLSLTQSGRLIWYFQ